MAEKTRQKTGSKTGSATLEFEDFELQSAMQDFLKEEPKEEGKGVWNFSTFAGLGMLFIAFTFLLQLIGFPMGQGLSAFAQDAISALPIIGGILVTLVGFGFLVGDRKKEKKAKKESRRKRKAQSKKNIYSSDIHGAEEFTSTLNNDLDSSGKSSSSSNYSYDNFGYRHAKRLMKSRTNKKIAGVCGGLAKYFGLSSTVVRFIFGAVFIMGWGTSLLIYIGLALAMPKEPIEMMDDFDF
ncbi:MAG: PspC domain-containing protein [Balneola sp.]|jgi:phage shock protein C|uniref:PspC domain-containing protein n=1 Tax=Balneola sp. EhC07 TaxID=1849360 RepID=UPI0009ECCC90|nr:PspC domain-containing protein [Balneola sp. EhC07]MBO6572472.1 PspC domain-containing protein [Balneola sp.]MBR9916484.1 PspC domain-containing protein [bacterium]